MVPDPDDPSHTLYDYMIHQNPPMDCKSGRCGNRLCSFVQHIGVPSLDISYGLFSEYPVYRSLYDDFDWMERFGDPLFHGHVALVSV